MRYTYLTIDLLTIAIPAAFSFHPRFNFSKTWFAFWPAMMLTAIPFLAWDVLFTVRGTWGFNQRYLLGIELLHLPLEEWLFFLCIPYACVFTYFCFKQFIEVRRSPAVHRVTRILGLCLLVAGVFYLGQAYTSTVCLLTGLLLLAQLRAAVSGYLVPFYAAYTILILPFMLVNGVLTGSFIPEQIVWYNNLENLGVRLFAIPVEDFAYALSLILANVTLYEIFLNRRTAK